MPARSFVRTSGQDGQSRGPGRNAVYSSGQWPNLNDPSNARIRLNTLSHSSSRHCVVVTDLPVHRLATLPKGQRLNLYTAWVCSNSRKTCPSRAFKALRTEIAQHRQKVAKRSARVRDGSSQATTSVSFCNLEPQY